MRVPGTSTLRRTGPAPRPPSARAPHPRIRDRRVEVARDLGRRRRRRLNVVLGVVCAAVWTLVLVRSPLLDVDRVQVDGAERTSAEAIRDAAGIRPGDPMAEVDPDGATRAVAALPWLDEVRVQRLWPGTVRIVVTERTPLAGVETPRGWARVDARGRVLDLVRAQPDLVALEGRRTAGPGDLLAAQDRDALATVAALPAELRLTVEAVTRDARGVVLDVGEGWSVVVGDDGALDEKAAAARAVRAAADPAAGCIIDVRVPDAPVLTPGGRCA